jgi:hypothetical protein
MNDLSNPISRKRLPKFFSDFDGLIGHIRTRYRFHATIYGIRKRPSVCIMHQQPKFTDLVHVLAVDFDIVDGERASDEGKR